jgi:hypothetical protein
MNGENDHIRDMWLKESAGSVRPPEASPPGAAAARSETARLRHRVRFDGWLKLCSLPFIGGALTVFAGRMSAASWGAIGVALLCAILGIVQLAWSAGWERPDAPLPLAQALIADMETWRRRRPALALLLGATPALAFQVYVLAYLALHPASFARLANQAMLVAGGPLLWLLASWRQWARLDAWLLQLQQALGAFDDETAKRLKLACKCSAARTAIIAGLMLVLLIAGAVLFFLAKRT